jgi:ribosome recycling factor
MTVADVTKDMRNRMSKTMDSLHHNLNSVRTGRAAPSLIEDLKVDYYGTTMPLNQLASISAPESRLLVIQPWDKGSMQPIEKAIQTSELGFNPNNDGQVIRIAIPTLTEDRRKQMVRVVHSHVEDAKVSVRHIRRDAMQALKALVNDKEIGEDDERRAQTELEAITKKFIEETDAIGKAKEHEVLEV